MKRSVRILLVAALIFSIVSLSLFMMLNAHHDHQGEYCQVCVRLETAAGILRGIFASFAVLVCCSLVTVLAARALGAVMRAARAFYNPVNFKVKLNN